MFLARVVQSHTRRFAAVAAFIVVTWLCVTASGFAHAAGGPNRGSGAASTAATGRATAPGQLAKAAPTTSPQPLSNADLNPGGANNGGNCGAYCSTRNGSPSLNGNGNGKAVGKPCAGCVGKADNKNPPGQAPNGSDHNNGYECDGNHGVGKTNPAHTGCASLVVSPSPRPSPSMSTSPSASPTATVSPSVSPTATVSPSVSPTATVSPSVSPTATVSPSVSPTATVSPSVSPTATVSPSVSPTTPTTTVLGRKITRTPPNQTPTVLPNRVAQTPNALPFTGDSIAPLVGFAAILLLSGLMAVVAGRQPGGLGRRRS